MKLENLLKGKTDCACGKPHLCPIDTVIIEKDVCKRLPALTAEHENILLVADENTYRAFGEQVENALGEKVANTLVYKRDGVLVPDEKAIAEMQSALDESERKCTLIVGVGSGVINDLCKYVAFERKLPYYIMATAPSMDGYASKGSALILNGMKVTLTCDVPKAILADTAVLKDAPFEMIQSGYGDIIGKYSCLNDWKLASVALGEYLCDFIWDSTYAVVEQTVAYAEGLKNRDEQSVGALMEALVAVGIFMAYVGNSRPASGSEHHLSHYFEIVGVLKKEAYLSHGIDVCYSAIETAALREKLLAIDTLDGFENTFDKAKYEKEIRRVYGSLAEEIFALQEKVGFYKTDRLTAYKEKWQEMKSVLKQAPTKAEMQSLVENIGLPYQDFKAFYGEEKIGDAIWFAKDLKDRYTVLWLWFDLFFGK